MPDLRALVRASFLIPSPLERYFPATARRESRDGVVLISYGLPGPDYNAAIVFGPIAPEEVFALADAFFGRTIYCIVVESETAAGMEAEVWARGWARDEEEPALALVPIPTPPPPPPVLAVRQVTTEREFADFIAVTGRPLTFVPSLAAALDPMVALFVGYHEDEPVATARVACYGAIGEVTGVVTAPAWRRRGLGTAMTWVAVAAGVERGCTAITLTASPMGYPVYVRMGFVPVCFYRTYLPPPEIAAELPDVR